MKEYEAIARAGIKAFKYAEQRGWLAQVKDYFKRKHTVLVLGSTGSGKTQLIDSLHTMIPEAIDRMNRTEFAKKHRLRLGREPFIFVDTPGQRLSATRRVRPIRRYLRQGIAGVLNVCSFGFHEYKADSTLALTRDATPRQQWLRDHRREELNRIDELFSIAGDGHGIPWLITAVTKADLWWSYRDQVMAYYEQGDYADAVREQAKYLDHVALEYCSRIQKYYGAAAVSGEFDESERTKLRAALIKALLSASTREAADA